MGEVATIAGCGDRSAEEQAGAGRRERLAAPAANRAGREAAAPWSARAGRPRRRAARRSARALRRLEPHALRQPARRDARTGRRRRSHRRARPVGVASFGVTSPNWPLLSWRGSRCGHGSETVPTSCKARTWFRAETPSRPGVPQEGGTSAVALVSLSDGPKEGESKGENSSRTTTLEPALAAERACASADVLLLRVWPRHSAGRWDN